MSNDSLEDSITEESSLPEKYQGKSIEDVVSMHQEAEKKASRLGNDVGTLRTQVTDLEASLKEPKEEVDFFDNPKEAMNNEISSNPELQEMRETTELLLKQNSVSALENNHKDFREVVVDPEFEDWLQKSPTRGRMMNEANDKYDAEAMSDLLTMFKDQKTNAATQEAEGQKEANRKEALKGAKSESGSGGGSTKKTYRREDIQRIQTNDIERYRSDAFQAELKQAYDEGRVK